MTNPFTFANVLLASSVVKYLSFRMLSVRNIHFQVTHGRDPFESHDLLTGTKILQRLWVDSSTLLEKRRCNLNDTDCINEPTFNVDDGDIIGRIQPQQVATRSQAIRPRFYQRPQNMHDYVFLDLSLLDQVDNFQKNNVVKAVNDIEQKGRNWRTTNCV